MTASALSEPALPQLAFEAFVDEYPAPAPKEASARTRYLGSKARIVQNILDIVGPSGHDGGRFIDVFSGTGAVSRQATLKGWEIVANDHLFSASVMTTAQILSADDVPFTGLGGYKAALQALSEAPPLSGFVFQEYTPDGKNLSHRQRKYFTPENGQAIDGMRQAIADWHAAKTITREEMWLLIADLLSAANSVANIAGTYGCFLRHWNANALRPLTLQLRSLLPERQRFFVHNLDAFDVPAERQDVAYLDPPYTKRQYAAYYHILETIAIGDSPKVEGITGLRPWREKSSPFCYKPQALPALERLITGLCARRIMLSYSSEGHIPLSGVEAMFKRHGDVTVHTIENIGRYRPNQEASAAGTNVTEYLVELIKHPHVSEILQ